MRARWRLVAVLVLVLAGRGGSGPARTPLVVDTDLSSDDAIALLYLAQDAKVDLRAVTVSGTGLVHCPAGAPIALGLLALAGRFDVPVACGADQPLAGLNGVPEDWRRAADGLFGLTVPPAARHAEADAAMLLRTAVGDAPRDATVLELAPMTNLAAALKEDPGLAGKLHRIVAMSGALTVPGNAPGQPLAETNAWIDPAAARAVLRSGAPVTLVPLDATNHVPVTTFVADALARYHYATPAATLAWEIIAATKMARGGSYFWDPLAAVAVTEPGLVRASARTVDVVTTGREAGRTVARAGDATRVVTSVDRAAFERELVGTLVSRARFRIPPHRSQASLTLDARGCTYRGAAHLTSGELVLDTVNRTSAPLQYAAGRLDWAHTPDDLRRFARGVSAASEAPSWFRVDATGTTPPHSDMTWVADLPTGTTGETVFVCVTSSPVRAWVAASVPVFADRRAAGRRGA